ncbi:MAG: hypothetical protein QM572_07000 [Nocardioides sp.]|uniref:WXG100-like domain-containing protein n=1 Tax=Nocardioides sp. TaxID=35761 RepID=UPI0039E469C4
MGMMLPDELVWILDKLGFDWPDLDEDEIHKGADLVRQFGSDLSALIDAVDRRIAIDLADASSSQTALAFVDGWTQTRSQHLEQALEFIDPAAMGTDVFADAVLALKIKVIADVTLTAAQVAAALASSFVTFGAGAAVAAGLIVARKAALKIVMNIAIEELLGQILPLVIEPLTEQIPTIVSSLLDSPIVTGAVGDIGEFKADLDALDGVSSDLALASGDLDSLTAQFIADISSLNISGG